MPRKLSTNKNYIITARTTNKQKKDDDGKPEVDGDGEPVMEEVITKAIKAECSAGDPAATNEFDKGPTPISVIEPFDGSMTLDAMMAACDAGLAKEAGITP